jgi:hypothetical protein
MKLAPRGYSGSPVTGGVPPMCKSPRLLSANCRFRKVAHWTLGAGHRHPIGAVPQLSAAGTGGGTPSGSDATGGATMLSKRELILRVRPDLSIRMHTANAVDRRLRMAN